MSSTTCETTLKKLVRWNISIIKNGAHKAYPEHEEVISECVTDEEFKSQKVVEFAEKRCREGRPLSPEDARNLHVYMEVLDCFETPAFDFEEEQVELLNRIRRTLAGENGHKPRRVRLPKSGCIAGALDTSVSEFGDEFVNFPDFLGQRPKPGETMLSGWVRVDFGEPQGDLVEFVLDYSAVGTPVTIEWGGGQVYNFFQTRTFPVPLGALPGIDTTNRGVLNLATGKVEKIALFSTFQGTTIARTDKVNRIPYAFPYIYPPLPLPEGFQPPEGYKPPFPPPRVFADVDFELDDEGNIVGFSLRSETFAPTGLFPFIPGLFPPFSWGRNGTFHFANPDSCKPGTPPANCPNDITDPNGILHLPDSLSVYFHPHINLIADGVKAVEKGPEPIPCAPEAVTEPVVLNARGRIYLLGGATGEGVSAKTWTLEPGGEAWIAGKDLPTAVAAAQGAVVGDHLYVLGGWTKVGGSVTDAVQVMDLETGEWRELAHGLPVAVAEASAAVVGDRIYVISGAEGTKGGKPKLSAAVQILDTGNEAWSEGQGASMPAAGSAALAVGSQIHVLGGRNDTNSASRRVGVYETQADQWGLGEDLAHPVVGGVAAHLGDRLLLMGGREKAGGAPSAEVQELYLEQPESCDEQGWRRGLPAPLAVAGAGGAVHGDTLYVLGGSYLEDHGENQGAPTDAAQSFHPLSGWSLCLGRPYISAAGVLNGAGFMATPEPNTLAPGARATLQGSNFPLAEPQRIRLEVGGKPVAQIFGALPAVGFSPERIDFMVPTDIDVSKGSVEVKLSIEGASDQAPPIRVPARSAAPGCYFYSFGETHELTFIDDGPALVCNADDTLNFANQPAAPGDSIFLYATGLGLTTDIADLDVRVGPSRKKAKVESIDRNLPFPAVDRVGIKLPNNVEFTNNLPVYLKVSIAGSGKKKEVAAANTVVISTWEEATRLDPPVPCAAGFLFVFGPPPS